MFRTTAIECRSRGASDVARRWSVPFRWGGNAKPWGEQCHHGISGSRKLPGALVSDQADFERWSRLTDKQRACLDPLLERKTSKEIARMIGVSKPTVDQRLTTARSVLGVDTRDQAAVEYARLKRTYDRITYDPMHIPDRAEIVPSDFAEGDPSTVIHLTDTAIAARSTDGTVEGLSNSLGLIWRRDHKGLARFALMMTMLVALLLVVHASLGISETLTRLVSG